MSELKDKIIAERLPSHIAIIMDGNGRWAKQRGEDRIFGHYQGVNSVRKVTEAATELGVKFLTLYTFSTENWNRPKAEVDGLMELLMDNIEKETPTFHKNNIRFTSIGDNSLMPPKALAKLEKCIAETAGNTGLTLVLALSYSSRWEIVDAAKRIAENVEKGNVRAEDVDEGVFAQSLCSADIPDPELMIRTGGEYRISNFLLWQIAYAELYFTDVMWPEFAEENLYAAILDYQSRERRFGKTSEQVAF